MDFSKYDTKKLEALYRCCKTKAYAFFRDPKATIALREEIERRRQPFAKRSPKGKGIKRRIRTALHKGM